MSRKLTPREKLLRRMELPDCDCKYVFLPCGCPEPCDCPRWLEPCSHVLAWRRDPKRQHTMPVSEWAELLWGTWPKEYVEPDLPEKTHKVLSRKGRVLIMAERHGAGRALRHPEDAKDDYFELLGRPVDGQTRADRACEAPEFVTQIVGATPDEILRDWIEPFDDDWTERTNEEP